MLRLRDIMTTDVATATPDLTLREAMELLTAKHISGAPVIAGGKVAGIFTASDLLSFLADLDGAEASVEFSRKRRTPLEEVTVSEIMTRSVHFLAPDCLVDEAARYMREANIHRILVMDGEELQGIATTTDVAMAVADHKLKNRTYVFA